MTAGGVRNAWAGRFAGLFLKREFDMRVLTVGEIDVVSGGRILGVISDDGLGDIAKGALAGGFAGFYISGGNPAGFMVGMGGGAIFGLAYHYIKMH